MTTQTTKTLPEQVVEMVSNETDVPEERITPDSDFVADLGFDSLTKVEFIMAVEERFDITVPDDISVEIKTVQQAVDAIQQALAKKGSRQ